jgi:Family of unknown function (DUF5923)
MQADMRDVTLWRKKTAIKITDSGLADVVIGGECLTVSLHSISFCCEVLISILQVTIDLISSDKDKSLQRDFCTGRSSRSLLVLSRSNPDDYPVHWWSAPPSSVRIREADYRDKGGFQWWQCRKRKGDDRRLGGDA